MPLETATYISDLVTSNPAASDPLSGADDHLRLLKAALKATFPNFTGAALGSSQSQIDAAASTVTNGVAVLADSGVAFKTHTTDKITNPAAGEIDLTLAGTLAAKFVNTSGLTFTWNGDLTLPAGNFTGGGICPIGSILIWPSDTLPPSSEGVFAWCNGQTISRTSYSVCFARIGTTYGAGDGSTTFRLPDYQEVVLVGKSTMGGAASPNILTTISAGVKAVMGLFFGAEATTLSTTNLPPYTPTGSNGTVTVSSTRSDVAIFNNNAGVAAGGNSIGVVGNGGQTIASSGSGPTFTGNAQGGTSTPFGNLPPSRVTGFIIRIR